MDFTLSNADEKAFGPTEKLFNEAPYLRETEAKVLFVSGPYIITDKTVFYAESGGQASDSGIIDGIKVVDVAKKGGHRLVVERSDIDVPAVTVNTIIVHQLEKDAPFKTGDTIKMKIDWPRRYDAMRYHSASHFLFYAAHQVYDKPDDILFTKGCSINNEGARFDFFGSLDGAQIPEVEKLANDLISEETPIVMEPEPLTKEIHYWRCGDILIPCGGTHVCSTEELGPLRVKRSKKGKTTTRIASVFIKP